MKIRSFGIRSNPASLKKNTSSKRITFIEQDNIITDEKTLAETFNAFFSIGTKDNKTRSEGNSIMTLDIHQIIAKFKNHPSIIIIKEKINCGDKFSFALSSFDDIKKMINNLNTTKPTTYNIIPAKIVVEYCDVCAHPIRTFVLNGTFPDARKLADITPSHKKHDNCLKENYRPISILSSLSKIFEKNMHADIHKYMENKLSPYLCGFRKGYSHTILSISHA